MARNDNFMDETLAVLAFWSELKAAPVILGDLPEINHRNALSYAHSAQQLNQVLKLCSKEMAYQPGLEP